MKYLIEKLEEALYQAKNRLLKKEADADEAKDSISAEAEKWTKEQPTEPGWYWLYHKGEFFELGAELIRVRKYGCDDEFVAEYKDGIFALSMFKDPNYFYGPLHPPTFSHKEEDDGGPLGEKAKAAVELSLSGYGLSRIPDSHFKRYEKYHLKKEKAADDDKEELYNYLKSTGPRHCVDWVRRNGGTLDDYMDYIKEELKKEKVDADEIKLSFTIDPDKCIKAEWTEGALETLNRMADNCIASNEAKCDHIVGLEHGRPDGGWAVITQFDVVEYEYHPPTDGSWKSFKYCPLCGDAL